MKNFKILFTVMIVLLSSSVAEDIKVKITKDVSSIDVTHLGQKVTIKRIQNPYHVLSDDYTKTSRSCPPFCIHPMSAAKGVETIGEVELVDFFKNKVKTGKGILVDSRLSSWYTTETIPSAINIPYTLVEDADKDTIDSIFTSLGAKKSGNKFDFTNAKYLAMFCNGVWCDQTPRLIKAMLKSGYPASRMKYYRDGFQGWKLLGFTTVIMDKKEVN